MSGQERLASLEVCYKSLWIGSMEIPCLRYAHEEPHLLNCLHTLQACCEDITNGGWPYLGRLARFCQFRKDKNTSLIAGLIYLNEEKSLVQFWLAYKITGFLHYINFYQKTKLKKL